MEAPLSEGSLMAKHVSLWALVANVWETEGASFGIERIWTATLFLLYRIGPAQNQLRLREGSEPPTEKTGPESSGTLPKSLNPPLPNENKTQRNTQIWPGLPNTPFFKPNNKQKPLSSSKVFTIFSWSENPKSDPHEKTKPSSLKEVVRIQDHL